MIAQPESLVTTLCEILDTKMLRIGEVYITSSILMLRLEDLVTRKLSYKLEDSCSTHATWHVVNKEPIHRSKRVDLFILSIYQVFCKVLQLLRIPRRIKQVFAANLAITWHQDLVRDVS